MGESAPGSPNVCEGEMDKFDGEVPSQMSIIDVPEAEYVVYEHGPSNYEQENCSIEEKIEEAMATFESEENEYCYDTSKGRIMYFYHNPERVWTEWFPTSGYEEIAGISFEMYYGLASHENGFGEIWIPVKKK